MLSRFISLAEGRYVALEDVIAHHLDQLFSGMDVVQHHTFRVTRNEDVEVEEDDAENLLLALEKELLRRKVGRPPVRLEVEDDMDRRMLELLLSELDISEREVFYVPGPLDLTGLFSLADIDRAELKYPAFLPSTHPHLAEVETAKPADMFAALKQRDVLLHHPYDSFATSVQRFIEQAADDPHVLAIKQTLYRTSGDSPIIDALIEAAEAGKQVLALVEIKARFDEQANIAWARRLEQHGCHVVYGLLGLKTHCKLSMVVRDEPDGLRRYAHIGTGNYNPKTARLYEDIGPADRQPDRHRGHRQAVQPPVRNVSGDAIQEAARCSARHPQRADPTGSTTRSPTTRTASQRASRSKSTRSLTRRRPMRSIAPPRPVFQWTFGCAASARSGQECQESARTSESAAFSAASWSTAATSGSPTMDRRRSGSALPI